MSATVEQWTEPVTDQPVPDESQMLLLEELRTSGLVQAWTIRFRYYDDGAAYLVAVPYEDEPRDLTPEELDIWLAGVADTLRHIKHHSE